MKLRLILCAIVALFCVGFSYGQDPQSVQAVQDSTITLIIPTKVDLTTTTGIQQFAQYLILMLITLIGGFWAKGRNFLDKYLNTTEKKVALTGFVLTFIAGLSSGFTKDVISALIVSGLTVFATMGIFGTVKTASKTDQVLPVKTDV